MKMNRPAYFVFLLASVAAAFLAGAWYKQPAPAGTGGTGGRRILYYTDPMHPAYRSDQPGTAPDCGMQLEPVYADGGPSGMWEDDSRTPVAPGSVKIGAGKQQLGGVRVGRAEQVSGTHSLRLVGRVAPDEGRIYRLTAGIEGFIQAVAPVTTGSQVKKDQFLATFAAPNALMTIQTYILNVGAEDRFRQAATAGSAEGQSLASANANVRQRVQQMQNIGISLPQIEEIKRTREVPESIKILAPAGGFVLARNVSPGQKFDRGAEWYRIADLSKIWVLADVFERDAHYLRPGGRAQVTVSGRKKTLSARISEVLPQFDATARTSGYVLRPDMFVDVELAINLEAAIAVPADAVLDSGRRKTVFVDRGEGLFEPREVETGWSFGGQVQIVAGLQPGEEVVTSGNFLLDSESRMQQAAKSAGPQLVKDPVCEMAIDPAKAAAKLEYKGAVYYLCSKGCKEKFVGNLIRYTGAEDATRVARR